MGSIGVDSFAETADGQEIERLTLTNQRGAEAQLLPIGATLIALKVPDRSGTLRDVVLGYDSLDGYQRNPAYLGCTIGRVANRISGAGFELNGGRVSLSRNAGDDHLHGGSEGISRRPWDVVLEQNRESGDASVSFYLQSIDGEDGYPGTVDLRVRYRLDPHNSLHIEYFARSDRETPINLTNHSYFNLAGHDCGHLNDHQLRLFASRITPTDEQLLPTGAIEEIGGSLLDFRDSKPLGGLLDDDSLQRTGGLDHNYLLDKSDQSMTLAAVLSATSSGIRMAVSTREPAVQVYTANSLALEDGKNGARYGRHSAICLETQGYPDAPNQPAFPSILLQPGDLYYSKTVFRFSTFD